MFPLFPHFRGVVWPRNDVETKKLYRYVVVGMIVSDKPLAEFEGRTEIALDGFDAGLGISLQTIEQVDPGRVAISGTADSVLTRLQEWQL